MFLHKLSKIVALVIGFLAVVFTIFCMTTEVTFDSGALDMYIYLSYLALFLTIGIVLFYVGVNFKDNKDKKKSLISLGLFVGTILIAFILADGTEVPLKGGEVISSGFSKFISTSLNTFYIIAIVAIGTLVYSSVGKLKK